MYVCKALSDWGLEIRKKNVHRQGLGQHTTAGSKGLATRQSAPVLRAPLVAAPSATPRPPSPCFFFFFFFFGFLLVVVLLLQNGIDPFVIKLET
jgi:hypothetical protein